VPSSSTNRAEEMGRPDEGDRRVSRVAVPVEMTGGEAGLIPRGSFSAMTGPLAVEEVGLVGGA
jgi:hypothetical protein